MRIILVTSILMAASLQGAFALRPASQPDLDAIEKQLADAKKLDSNINAAIKNYSKAAADVNTTEAKLRELDKAVEQEMAKQRAARTKAIHMVILAYDLAPASLNGTSVMRWTKDRTITWLPVAGEGEDRQLQNTAGKLKESKKPTEAYSGVTFPDGVTYIPESTFKNGAGFLASVLFHERTHFEQYTTEGMGDVMSKTEREVNAYQKQLENTQIFLDPVKDKDAIAEIKGLLRAKKTELQKENSLLGRIRRHLPSNDHPDKSELTLHSNAELADISGLVAQARSQADISRRDREEREARARAAAEKSARRDHDERLIINYAEMARRSCESPGSVSQAELDALPRSYGTDVMNTMPRGLGDCAGMVYSMLLHGSTADQIRASSEPGGPARLNPDSTPTKGAPSIPPDFRAAQPARLRSFSTMIPLAKDLAVTACQSPHLVTIDSTLTLQYFDIGFSPERDDRIVNDLLLGLGACEGRLFRRLIEIIRNGEGPGISVRWVQEAAAAYRPAPAYYPPPSGGRCEEYGNIRCPH